MKEIDFIIECVALCMNNRQPISILCVNVTGSFFCPLDVLFTTFPNFACSTVYVHILESTV